MPSAPARACPVARCPHRIPRGGACPVHPPDAGRTRRSARARGYDAAYERRRVAVLGGPCALRLPGCTGIATTADHIIPVSRGGRDGPLQGACAHCNAARGNRDLDTSHGDR